VSRGRVRRGAAKRLAAGRRADAGCHHRVYVVRLNHPRAKGREAFYVGMTGLPVEERFANHKRGYKSAAVVHKYGVELARDWYEDIPPMPFDEAVLAEATLADDLRDLGYLVFGPTFRTKNEVSS
jgi:predicted GIY-YIG superfamily endonuclease